MGLLDRLAPRRIDSLPPPAPRVADGEPVYATKALCKFVASLASREMPVLLDLGPVVGSNVSFFGEQLGCKIFVEDLFADLDRHVRQGRVDDFPEFLKKRFPQPDGTVDGVLCWDFIDFIDRPSAQELARQLTRLLRSDGALLGFFETAQPSAAGYTKHIIVDEVNLRYRPYEAARGRQAALPNRDIQRLFGGLRISESFLLQNSRREVLFRKPA